jgi:hypothetical protein
VIALVCKMSIFVYVGGVMAEVIYVLLTISSCSFFHYYFILSPPYLNTGPCNSSSHLISCALVPLWDHRGAKTLGCSKVLPINIASTLLQFVSSTHRLIMNESIDFTYVGIKKVRIVSVKSCICQKGIYVFWCNSP